MNTKERYRVGFEDGATCAWAQDNLDRVPIVDMKSFSAFGQCIAIADDEDAAQRIVDALNLQEDLKKKFLPQKGL